SHPTSKKRTKDDPSTYLSVATVPTDCTGFRWPCRLFRVRGVGRAMTATDLPNKRGFLSIDVIEELPAHEAFGPQGEHVVALIERAARLTRDEEVQLAASRAKAASAAVNDASYAAWDAAEDAGREAAAYTAWIAARYAAGVAARALVVRDLIGSSGFTQDMYR